MPGAFLWGWDATNEEWVKCVVNADGKLIINPTGFLENPPTEDEDKKAPTSEWAFDHDADVAAHHTKYTDVESRAAINNIIGSDGKLDGNLNCDYNDLTLVYVIRMQRLVTDNYYTLIKSTSSGRHQTYQCYQKGVGYTNFDMIKFNGSANVLIIDQDNFQAELDDYLENPPTEDVADKAPTSEWAFDHDADAAAHHAKYTDKEAVDAFKERQITITTGTETSRDISDISMIFLNTAGGDITLEGFDGGYTGKIVLVINTSGANDVIVDYLSGNAANGDRILTYSMADETLTAGNLGSFYMVYKDPYWWIDKPLT